MGIFTKLLICILMASTYSFAHADWEIIGENSQLGISIYSDFDSIKGGPRYMRLRTLYNYKEVNHEFGHNHLSEFEINEYDCKLKKVRLMEFTWYKEIMGKGEVVWSAKKTQPWQHIPSQSVHMTNSEIICKAFAIF